MESMANALCNLGASLGLGIFLVLPLPETVIHLSSSFFPFRRPRTPPFALRTFLLCISAQVYRKFVVWLEIYFKLIACRLEAVALILLVPHVFVRFDVMGLLALVYFLQWGHVFFFGSSSLSFSFFCFSQALTFLRFLCMCLRDLHHSSRSQMKRIKAKLKMASIVYKRS